MKGIEVIRGWHNLKARHKGCVIAIGNFDGVHRGHQALLQKLKEASRQFNLPSLVLTFEPQPNEFFSPDKKSFRLMNLSNKIQALNELKIDRILVGYFNQSFSMVSAEDFVRDYLVDRLGVKTIIVGDDFQFGAMRKGDVNLLRMMGQLHGFAVEEMGTMAFDSERVSSTLIRQSLEAGNLTQAEQCLGHRYAISGRVIHGEKLGRNLGFPTANINLDHFPTPLQGIFAVLVEGLEAGPIKGVASIGTRPTVGGTKLLLEVYLFNFDQTIYGRRLKVNFVAKYRDQVKFSSVELMQKQIAEDVAWAESILEY